MRNGRVLVDSYRGDLEVGILIVRGTINRQEGETSKETLEEGEVTYSRTYWV